jgi:ribosome-binding protein aMBF1 (putative translation factor)
LEQLPTDQFATAAFYIDLLAERGLLLGEPYTRQLHGKLRELRFHLEGQALRVSYWIAPERRIVLLTVFGKTRMREYREVARARRALHKCVAAGHTADEGMKTVAEHGSWAKLRSRRMHEPGADEAYESARMAYELGREVREMREGRGWSQAELARAAGMTQSAVARFEAGGTVPTIPVLHRLARALDAALTVKLTGREVPDPAANVS